MEYLRLGSSRKRVGQTSGVEKVISFNKLTFLLAR